MTSDGHPEVVRTMTARAELASIDLVHALLDDFWAASDTVGTVDRTRFETAVMEIVANIVEHAAAADPPGDTPRTLRVELATEDDVLVAEFGDDGRPMGLDLAHVTMPGDDAESGRGLALAMAAVDSVQYFRDGAANRWRIECRRSGTTPTA